MGWQLATLMEPTPFHERLVGVLQFGFRPRLLAIFLLKKTGGAPTLRTARSLT